MLKDKLTILVCSCDEYEDLWIPFFTLLKKYLNPQKVQILLNTEKEEITFEGLNIKCIHPPAKGKDWPYGRRMKYALSQVETEYTLLLLDDFFIRAPVDVTKFEQIIDWMTVDRTIVCFNFEGTKAYADWECNVYPGFRRLPPGNKFMLNMQAAIWRTKSLQKYWRPKVSPWEWEAYCNVLTTKYPRDKFYCAMDFSELCIDYGHYESGDLWGVVKGKWIVEDVQPLFEREGISVDFSKRGDFKQSVCPPYFKSMDTLKDQFSAVFRCLGVMSTIRYFSFRVRCKLAMKAGKLADINYFAYLTEKKRREFLSI